MKLIKIKISTVYQRTGRSSRAVASARRHFGRRPVPATSALLRASPLHTPPTCFPVAAPSRYVDVQ